MLLKIIVDDSCDNNYDANESVSSALLSVSMSALCGVALCCEGKEFRVQYTE